MGLFSDESLAFPGYSPLWKQWEDGQEDLQAVHLRDFPNHRNHPAGQVLASMVP